MPQVGANGIIPLLAYPDCTQPHSGVFRSERVYIVGWGTEHERLFRSTQAAQAITYRNGTDKNLRISRADCDKLCDQAVTDLYG
jgi:hypothetical protein